MAYETLTCHHLLSAYDTPDQSLVLSIVDIRSLKPSVQAEKVSNLDAICRLRLPVKRRRASATRLWLTFERPQREYTDADFHVPFHLSQAYLMAVDIAFEAHYQEEFQLIVPSSTFTKFIDAAEDGRSSSKVLSWEEWGPENTHIFRDYFKIGDDSVGVHGMLQLITRIPKEEQDVVPPPGTTSRIPVQVWEFRQLAARKYRTDLSLGVSIPQMRLSAGSSYGASKVFENQDIRTTLLARVTDVIIEIDSGMAPIDLRDITPLEDCIHMDWEVRLAYTFRLPLLLTSTIVQSEEGKDTHLLCF